VGAAANNRRLRWFYSTENPNGQVPRSPIKRFLLGLLLAVLGFVTINGFRMTETRYISLIGGTTMIVVAVMLVNHFPAPKKKVVVYTMKSCVLCNIKTLGEYENGDIVFNKGGQCNQCSGEMIIQKIYSVHYWWVRSLKKNISVEVTTRD
jgi:hypothetical protein